MKIFYDICAREIIKLDSKSKTDEGLSGEDLKKLNMLASALRAYSSSPIDESKDEIDLSEVSIEDLIALAKA